MELYTKAQISITTYLCLFDRIFDSSYARFATRVYTLVSLRNKYTNPWGRLCSQVTVQREEEGIIGKMCPASERVDKWVKDTYQRA